MKNLLRQCSASNTKKYCFIIIVQSNKNVASWARPVSAISDFYSFIHSFIHSFVHSLLAESCKIYNHMK